MRRKDREILETEQIEKVIHSCHCCRIGFYDNGSIYIVPLNFRYEKMVKKSAFTFMVH